MAMCEEYPDQAGMILRRAKFADLQSAGAIWPKEDTLQDEESGFAGESSA
jgi:hypothetical protein